MVAIDRARGFVVEAVDGVDVSVAIAEQLLAAAAVHFHRPKRVHLLRKRVKLVVVVAGHNVARVLKMRAVATDGALAKCRPLCAQGN